MQSLFPETIEPSQIGLPTGGVVVDSVEQRDKGRLHWRVSGRVLSCDSCAEPIRFRALLPCEGWNGRMLHVGGGGFNGSIPFLGSNGIGAEMWFGRPDPVAQGYVVFGSDSGHRMPRASADTWSSVEAADFSLHDEMLANFAHEHIKKAKDAVCALVQGCYGSSPRHVYYAGTSNGGREALLAAQRYPDDYDGIICGYPAIHWVAMALFGLACADAEDEAGTEGFIDADTWRKAASAIESNISVDNAIARLVSGRMCEEEDRRELHDALADVLNPRQLSLVEACASSLDVGVFARKGFERYPGYALVQGAPLRDDFNTIALNALSSAPGARNGAFAQFGHAVVSRQVMRSADFDTRRFDPAAHVHELRQASQLLDASSTNFDQFVSRGGKAFVYHGTYDQLISVKSSVWFYQALRARYGERLALSMRFFVVPGLGHSIGKVDLEADLLGAMDAWVTEGGTGSFPSKVSIVPL